MLDVALNTYLDNIIGSGATLTEWLNQGSADFTAFDANQDITLHPDLKALWQRFNGMTLPDGSLLQQTWLDGQFSYFSINAAAADYQASLPLWEDDPHFEEYWPKGFVPLGTPGDGSRLLVNCRANSPTYGAVYDLIHGIGVSRMSDSLVRYFETLNACLTADVIKVTAEGDVDVDLEAMKRIGKPMNSGCDAFDDTLEAAAMTQDWQIG